MILFSNSKINLGLWVLNKRADGYHNIATIFYPIYWQDVLEIIPDDSSNGNITIYTSGIPLNIPTTENILYKTYQILKQQYPNLPSVKVYLHKNVPHGAGLGAGSANAAYFIKACQQIFNLNLTTQTMQDMASTLGADCAFFILNQPSLALEKGNILLPINVHLPPYYILVVYPNFPISTKEAYSKITPKHRHEKLEEIVQLPISEWKYYLHNDFENAIFPHYPVIKQIKEMMYNQGALYSSMSGSGSAVFGIFKEKPNLNVFTQYHFYLGTL